MKRITFFSDKELKGKTSLVTTTFPSNQSKLVMDTRGETPIAASSTTIVMDEKPTSFQAETTHNESSVPVPTETQDSGCRDAISAHAVPPAPLVPVHQVQVQPSTRLPQIHHNESTSTRTAPRTTYRLPRQTHSRTQNTSTGMRTTGSFLTGFIISGVVLIISSISMFTSGGPKHQGVLTLEGDKIYQTTNYYRILAPVFLGLGLSFVITGMVLSFKFCGYFKRGGRSRSDEECHVNLGFNDQYLRSPRVISDGRFPTQDLFGQIPTSHRDQVRLDPPPPSYFELPPPYSQAVNSSPQRY